MKTTIPQLRKMIRKVITEANIKDLDTSGIYRPRKAMKPSHPDYEMVAEVIMQVTRRVMRSDGMTGDEVLQLCEEIAGDYQVHQHLDYIFDSVNANKLRMGL